ncbi:MAG: hypothetical protein R2699_10520 [Acidimicrobiales bacterium]
MTSRSSSTATASPSSRSGQDALPARAPRCRPVHLRPVPELPDFPTSVAFTVGPDGTATAVEISTFADVGQGTLTRVG